MAVIDASVLIEHLVQGPGAPVAEERLLAEAGALRCPHLVDAEVGHVLRGRVARGGLAPGRARDALDELAGLPLLRSPHAPLLERAWALRADVSFYDALYVALAELVEEPLLTFDGRLARASGVRAKIEVLG